LIDLETLLRGASVEESSYLEKRTDVEIFLVAALKELVQMKKAGSSAAEAMAAEEQGSSSEDTSAGPDTSEQLQAEIANLKKQLADQTEEVDSLRDQLRRRIEASDSEADSRLLISQLQDGIDSLRSQLGESEERVDRLAARLAESEAANRSLETQVGSLRAEIGTTRLKAVEEGRDDALGDVMTFLNYLSGSGQKGTQAEQSLLAQARKDPLYRAVTREIQILIVGGSSAGDLAAPYRFLGIVSSVSAGKLIIEAMVDLRITEKALVQIRRISDLERELAIAEGQIQQILGSKITATYRLTGSSGQRPAARDLVYIEVE